MLFQPKALKALNKFSNRNTPHINSDIRRNAPLFKHTSVCLYTSWSDKNYSLFSGSKILLMSSTAESRFF